MKFSNVLTGLLAGCLGLVLVGSVQASPILDALTQATQVEKISDSQLQEVKGTLTWTISTNPAQFAHNRGGVSKKLFLYGSGSRTDYRSYHLVSSSFQDNHRTIYWSNGTSDDCYGNQYMYDPQGTYSVSNVSYDWDRALLLEERMMPVATYGTRDWHKVNGTWKYGYYGATVTDEVFYWSQWNRPAGHDIGIGSGWVKVW